MKRQLTTVATVAGLAVVWGIAVSYLWRSKVPSSLRLPHIDTAATYPAEAIHRATSYDSVASLVWLAGVAVELIVLGLYAWKGAAFSRESAAGPIGTGMLLGMLGFALLWLAELPATIVGLWWDRRHGVSHVSYVSAILGGWVQLGLKFVLLCIGLGVVMGLARLIGSWWWLAATPVFAGLVLVLVFVSPYLAKTSAPTDPRLVATVTSLERKEGVGHVPVRIMNVSSDTSLPNAEAEGIGPSRRIVIWNTLLDGRFSPGEIRVVVGHELGHLARNHILKSVAWYALFLATEAFIISLIVRRRGGMGEPAAVPLAVFSFVVLGLLVLPLQNAISRRREAEADWIALQTTRDPADAALLFETFVPAALSNPNPPTWEYLFLYDHPTIDQRVAMTRAWKARYATSASAAQLP